MARAVLADLLVTFIALMAVPIWITYRGGEEVILRDVRLDDLDP